MKNHISSDQLVGHVQHTLTDAQREVIDQHLMACARCRARLDEHQAFQRRVRQNLSDDLQQVAPSSQMTFHTVAPRLPSNRLQRWQRRAATPQALPAVAALGGLVLAVMTLTVGIRWADISLWSIPTDVSTPTSLPAIACLLFSIPVVANYREQGQLLSSRPLTYIVTVLLWLGTALVGLYELFVMRELLYHVYVVLGGRDPGVAAALGVWGVLVLALVWIGAFIGGAEYHYQHVGERQSWRLFGWIIAIEVVILVLAYLI
jgi:hypothetical protein